jgi:hypothetical protein
MSNSSRRRPPIIRESEMTIILTCFARQFARQMVKREYLGVGVTGDRQALCAINEGLS